MQGRVGRGSAQGRRGPQGSTAELVPQIPELGTAGCLRATDHEGRRSRHGQKGGGGPWRWSCVDVGLGWGGLPSTEVTDV